MAAGDYTLNLGHITGLGMHDINGDDAVPQMRPGTIAFVVDAFGYRVLRYCNFKNAMLQGELASRAGGVNGTTVITDLVSGTTTSATDSGQTADLFNGALFYVHDNADSAGAAPEGEMSVVTTNTASLITLEPDLPMSVAMAVNDDVTIISNWQVQDSADGDLSITVMGVVIGNQGITSGRYGWVQMEGFAKALTSAASITTFNPVVSGANLVAEFGTDGQELWIGTSLGTFTSDNVALTLPVRLNCFSPSGIGTAP